MPTEQDTPEPLGWNETVRGVIPLESLSVEEGHSLGFREGYDYGYEQGWRAAVILFAPHLEPRLFAQIVGAG